LGLSFVVVALLGGRAGAQAAPDDSAIVRLARGVAGETGTTPARTRALAAWVYTNLRWSATDYVRLSPREIILRGEGNCADLAAVLLTLLNGAGIRARWVGEINVQPRNDGRQERAAARVREAGPRMSVFGRRHNDHRWLEVLDDSTGRWFPADPAVGVVGEDEWVRRRLAFVDRPDPPVAAAKPIVAAMIVPFAVTTLVAPGGAPVEDRTEYYLIDRFNTLYGGRLATLPSWPRWISSLRELSRRAAAAFAGRQSLHDAEDAIATLATTYDALGHEAAERGLTPAR
jgi:hypothetical protein